MKLTVKKLQGGECAVEADPTTYIKEIKKQVASHLGIPAEEQRLLLLGRTLADEEMVQSYPSLKDGMKVHLIIKKPDTFYEAAVKYFKRCGMRDAHAAVTASRLVKRMDEKFKKLSWDDIERISRNMSDDNEIIMEYESSIW